MCRMWPSLYVQHVVQLICAICGPVYMCSVWYKLYTQYVAQPQPEAHVHHIHDVVAVLLPRCKIFMWSDSVRFSCPIFN